MKKNMLVGESQLKYIWGNMPEAVKAFTLTCQY